MRAPVQYLRDHLEAAVEAAKAGDGRTYFLELAASHALDAVTRGLTRSWPGVDATHIELAVARAADELFTKAAAGVISPAGFLWGTARNLLLKQHEAGMLLSEPFDQEDPGHNQALDDEPGPDRDALRAEGLRFARTILPSLGQTVVIQVMTFVFDCVEKGETYVDNQTIAEALGLTGKTVRQAKYRGFQRLAREAQRHGINIEDVVADDAEDEEESAG